MTRGARSSGRWSVTPAALVLVLFLSTGAAAAIGYVMGQIGERANGRAYCATYGTMTGTSTRYAAGECWVQYADTPDYWAPLHEPTGGRG